MLTLFLTQKGTTECDLLYFTVLNSSQRLLKQRPFIMNLLYGRIDKLTNWQKCPSPEHPPCHLQPSLTLMMRGAVMGVDAASLVVRVCVC